MHAAGVHVLKLGMCIYGELCRGVVAESGGQEVTAGEKCQT